jgi:EAL domain-containing protein (putative c-di-GMP-specific phosphodiesterase class I)
LLPIDIQHMLRKLCTLETGLETSLAGASLCLIIATPDVQETIAGLLTEQQLLFERRGPVIALLNHGDQAQVVDLLRHRLIDLRPEEVMVVSEGPTGFGEWRSLDEWWRITETGWFDEAIREDACTTWFQPVVDTTFNGVLGYECLARVDKSEHGRSGRRTGAEILDAARLRGEERSFDAHLRKVALRTAAEFGAAGVYFVNFLPRFIYEPELCMAETFSALVQSGLPPSAVVFEAVNAGHVKPRHLGVIADSLRARDCGLSLDDLSISNGGRQLIYDLRPDYIKLSSALTADIEAPACATAVRRLVEAADETGTTVIAKNVEDVTTMENLWLLGVHVMQGSYFGLPVPAPDFRQFDLLNLTAALERPETSRQSRN